MHSEKPKLHRVLAILSAVGLKKKGHCWGMILGKWKLKLNFETYNDLCLQLSKKLYTVVPQILGSFLVFRSLNLPIKILKFGTPQTIAIIVLKLVKFDVTLH